MDERVAAAYGQPEGLWHLVGQQPWVDQWLAANPDTAAMERLVPRTLPRNLAVEYALAAARDGDLSPVRALATALHTPQLPPTAALAETTLAPGHRAQLERLLSGPDPAGLAGFYTTCGT